MKKFEIGKELAFTIIMVSYWALIAIIIINL